MASIWALVFFTVIYFQANVNIVEGKKGFGDSDQDWGYVKVRSDAYAFWWLYYVDPPAKLTDFNVFNKPLLIWLQEGSKGSASGFGNFGSTGSLDANLQKRNHTLIKDYNVLYVDNPVGIGFSYVKNSSRYAKTNTEMATDLLKVIQSFLSQIPQFKNTPTYIIGQSYGGRVGVELALLWYQDQAKGTINSQLKGVAIGNSWISPMDLVFSWATYLQTMGIIEDEDYNEINRRAETLQNVLNDKKWCDAYFLSVNLRLFINTILDNTFNSFNIPTLNNAQKTTLNYSSNGLWNHREIPLDITNFNNHTLMNNVKVTLNLSSNWVKSSKDVIKNLECDSMKPVTSIIERLLNETNLKVYVYNGQLDSVVTIRGTFEWVEKLRWNDVNQWKSSKRVPLLVDNIVDGFVREYQNFKMFAVLRAGHHVPIENPFAMKAILQDLTSI